MASPVFPIVVVGGILVALLSVPDSKDTSKNIPSKVLMVFITVVTISIKAYMVHCIVSGGETCGMYAWLNSLLICVWMLTAIAMLMHKKLIAD